MADKRYEKLCLLSKPQSLFLHLECRHLREHLRSEAPGVRDQAWGGEVGAQVERSALESCWTSVPEEKD